MCSSDIFLALLAILFPPIAVWIKSGLCTADSLINILLCTLGYIPGLLHAWYIISLYPEPSDDAYEALPDAESGVPASRAGGVTFYYVDHQGMRAGGAPLPPQQQQQQQGGGYGTVVGGGEGASGGGVPPSYEQAVRGDHKVQV